MKHCLVVVCLGLVLFSCGSKKRVVTKKSKEEKTQHVYQKKNEETKIKPIVKTSSSHANSTVAYIETYKAIAQKEMQLYNIPASITLAQGILESASGKGRLSVKANNHFGIKCHEWRGAKIYHDDDRKGECFRKYKDAKYSFRDHSLFLSEKKRYSKLFSLRPGDYKGWARGLKAAGYATDSKYPQKLISIIERYNLTAYDNLVIEDKNIVSVREVPKKITHVVVKGDTLYYIANMHNMSVEELKEINGLKDNTIKIGQELQVSKK